MKNLKQQSFNRSVLSFMLFFPYLLDIAGLLGKKYSPAIVENFTCLILPFAKVSSLFFPASWLNIVNGECPFQFYEPSTSIILFMFKISTTLAVTVLLSLITIISNFKETYEKISDQINKDGALIKKLKNFCIGISIFGFTALITLFPLFDRYRHDPAAYRESLPTDIIENFACSLLSLTLYLFIISMIFYILYLLKQVKTKSQI